MMFKPLLSFLIGAFLMSAVQAQLPTVGTSATDSLGLIKHTKDFSFQDGIYLSVDQVKRNKPIPTDHIVSKLDRDNLDFCRQLVEGDQIEYFDETGKRRAVFTKEIWGYSSNGHLHINWNSEFNKIPVVGNVCHFVSNKTVYQDNTYNPYAYSRYGAMQVTPQTRVEMRQYLFDFETERVYDYDLQAMNMVLARDAELFLEWDKLRKRKKRDLKFVYIRKYNERNPLYLKK